MNTHRIALACVTPITAICCTTALAQTTVKRIQSKRSIIAAAIWAGDTLYVSGPLPAPTPADSAKGKADFADMNDAYRQFASFWLQTATQQTRASHDHHSPGRA